MVADALSRKGQEKLSMLTTQSELITEMSRMELEVKLPSEPGQKLFTTEIRPTIVSKRYNSEMMSVTR